MRSLEKEKVQVHKNQILNEEEFFERKNIKRNKRKKNAFISNFFNFLFCSGVCGFIIGLFLLYGPYNGLVHNHSNDNNDSSVSCYLVL